MNLYAETLNAITRRHFFKKGALGLGGAALGSLMQRDALAAGGAGVPGPGGSLAAGGLASLPHYAPKAKRAIYLFMAGAPAQIDMLDYKPTMEEMFDKDLPESIRQGQRLTTMTSGQKRFPIAPSRYKFAKYDNNEGGAWVSELLPHTASIVKDIAIVKTIYTEAINHDPAITYICTGHQLPGRASLGAWLAPS